MQKPIHPLVAEIVGKLDADLCEEFEERAAIMAFDAKLPRDHAECLALLDVLHRHPDALKYGSAQRDAQGAGRSAPIARHDIEQ